MLRGYIIKACVAMLASASLCACSSGGTNENKARGFLDKAVSCYKTNPDSALSLLDALSKRFPDSISLQREALHLRTQINDVVIARQMAENDSLLAAETAVRDSLAPRFRWVYEKGMVEGFWVENGLGGALEQGTAFQPRIDKYKDIYIATIVSGRNLGYKSMTVSCNGTSITAHSTQNNSFDGREFVTFHDSVCDSICKLMAENPNLPVTVKFSADNGKNWSMSLPQNVKATAVDTYLYSRACKLVHHAAGLQTYLVQKRAINKKQIEKTSSW